MTKADLVEEVSRVTELTRKDSEVIVDQLFDSVIKALKAGDKLEVRGFGSFRVRQRNARVGRNATPGTSRTPRRIAGEDAFWFGSPGEKTQINPRRALQRRATFAQFATTGMA